MITPMVIFTVHWPNLDVVAVEAALVVAAMVIAQEDPAVTVRTGVVEDVVGVATAAKCV